MGCGVSEKASLGCLNSVYRIVRVCIRAFEAIVAAMFSTEWGVVEISVLRLCTPQLLVLLSIVVGHDGAPMGLHSFGSHLGNAKAACHIEERLRGNMDILVVAGNSAYHTNVSLLFWHTIFPGGFLQRFFPTANIHMDLDKRLRSTKSMALPCRR